MRGPAIATMLALTVFACASAPQYAPAPEHLAPWTTALRDSQPDGAYAAVYNVGKETLVFVAAEHANETDSPTFKIIEDAFRLFEFQIVIVEGFPASEGLNPAKLVKYAGERAVNGFQEGGEAAPAARGALNHGALLQGGEPDDRDVRDYALSLGFKPDDILGFYTLRTAPQLIRERKIDSPADPAAVALITNDLSLNRSRLGFDSNVLPDYQAFRRWYEKINGKPFDASFLLEETGPLADGRFGSNAVAAAIARARDSFLHELVIEHVNQQRSALVVFGGSHYLIQRPALEAAIGAPCYVGAELEFAPASCR